MITAARSTVIRDLAIITTPKLSLYLHHLNIDHDADVGGIPFNLLLYLLSQKPFSLYNECYTNNQIHC